MFDKSSLSILTRTKGHVVGASAVDQRVIVTMFPLGFHLFDVRTLFRSRVPTFPAQLHERAAKQMWALPKAWGVPQLGAVWISKTKRFVVPCGKTLYSWSEKAQTLQEANSIEVCNGSFPLLENCFCSYPPPLFLC